MLPAPDLGSGGDQPYGGGGRKLSGASAAGSGPFHERLLNEFEILSKQLTPVVRNWLKARPPPEAYEALVENINSIFWLIEDEYLPLAEEPDAALLQQLNVELRSSAISLSELRNSDRRSRVEDLAEAHAKLLELSSKLREVLKKSARKSSA
jgi:hypothetical protein